MGKFTTAESDVFSVFASQAWKDTGLKTIPSNFPAPENVTQFLRVSILPSGKGVNALSVSGLIIVDIFTTADAGPKAASTIADTLEQHLARKSVRTGLGTTQFQTGSLSLRGKDSVNPLLFHSSYSIPFTFFGDA